ncbi:Lrp/AsnC family transcriptional regulator [Streptomyces nodosus]|uniref:AsnC family transcriptional regulator n=1 Tax=Streptomyces nodosus TaxID=40318 RepID=A0A0B5DFH0_9ACTN|nr:Lrp/AsnC family transcriptional regulator [Streptomyces nodosus]AJE38747.1 AsnC family transcriptional regulator [Streptomyces nodosus]MBB4789481.1 Lrp/AsnC family transcriptional regulator for asnA, asnC and gidA [Streptomyces nodosus]QEV37327.1 Lrp/AsnC family transcriptional regulator [Streptomyces nodosus]
MIDDLDRAIMSALARDGRTPYTTLARQLAVSEATVRQRVSRLQVSGALRIVALCNPLTLGHQSVRLMIRVRDLTPRAVAKSLADMPMINHVALVAGSQDIFLEGTCRDQAQLVQLLDEIRMLPGVSRVQVLLLLELFKDYSWNGLNSSVGQAVADG